jgi:hypothetical protein
VPTLHAAAELLLAANSIDGLIPLACAIGCDGDVAPLDDHTLHALGVADEVTDARIAAGRGALRALLVALRPGTAVRERLPRIAARLSARAPHVLWIVLAVDGVSDDLAIAAWTNERHPPRLAALIARRDRLVDSDAETIRALAAAAGGRDLLTHARWVEVLGRDALTSKFYRALERSIAVIASSDRASSEAVRRELALLDTSRLLFLSFLEAKGWLDRDHAFLAHQFEQCVAGRGGFRERVLRPLFFGTLNTPVRKRASAARRFGSVPFLNGGLFARTPLERRHASLSFSDDSYGSLLFDVFAQYRFTAREETSSWSEAAVDPEMLGKAFESLMASPERRKTGAFFTPFSLVERVAGCGLESLPLDRLDDVRRLTVLDPACGSGAFLVHTLERLAARARALGDTRSLSAVRRDVLTRSIFGVDVNPTAVWLCQLRLWLSVVIESEDTNAAAVMPLPNLDRNVRIGDALSGHAFTEQSPPRTTVALARMRERYARATGPRKKSLSRELDRAERARVLANIDRELEVVAERRRDLLSARRGRDLFGGRYRPSPAERETARLLRDTAAALRASRRSIVLGGALPFSFPTHFADVAACGGFSLIVGNPPWVRLHRIPANQRQAIRRDFTVARLAAWQSGATAAGAGAGFAAQIDVASLFIERCVGLLAPDAVLSLLVPAKLWRSLAGGGVRQLLQSETAMLRVEDYSEAPAAFDAAVYPSLIVARKCGVLGAAPDTAFAVHHRGHAPFTWASQHACAAFDHTPGAPWLFLPPAARRPFDALRQLGRPLSESALGRPLLGVKCGCNDAFVVEIVDVHGDLAEVVTSAGGAITVERSLIRPLLRGERLRRWHAPGNYEAILWTHDAAGSPLAGLPPLAARWFTRWRHTLIARSDARHRARWWSLFRIESARHDKPRVVWADVGKEARASVIPAGDDCVPLNSCYVVRCRDDIDAHAFCALLNGPVARAWLNALAEPARGGYHRYLGWTLSLLPVPTEWERAREILAPLGLSGAAGEAVGEVALLEASADAYRVSTDDLAPLVAWSAT